ncbi:hypothetical protein DSUL_100034 [Desulfovibrionales bacterium]
MFEISVDGVSGLCDSRHHLSQRQIYAVAKKDKKLLDTSIELVRSVLALAVRVLMFIKVLAFFFFFGCFYLKVIEGEFVFSKIQDIGVLGVGVVGGQLYVVYQAQAFFSYAYG